MKRIFKPLFLALVFPSLMQVMNVNTMPLYSQVQTSEQNFAEFLKKELPFDTSVRTGVLPNGLKYYIRRNTEPEKRVVMYLGIKAGSILENEEQLGLAHFLEHMNFNGSTHFPKNDLVNYLQKVGVKFGGDLNAYTSFDETVYQLPIPSDNPEYLKNGLLVLRDWAQNALLTSEEIDKERGVVLEEMRGGRGAMHRMQQKFLPVMFNHSHYANRLPIGTEKVITTFKHDVLRKFHKDWYRPNLQSVIIVGDINEAEIEKEVIRLFSEMKNPENAPERKEFSVPLLNKNQFLAVTDPEMPSTTMQLIVKFEESKIKTIGDYREQIASFLYQLMINQRLDELRKTATPPFLGASVSIGNFLANLATYSADINPIENQYETGFKTVIREIERAQKFGFTNTEFERALIAISKEIESDYKERDKTKSAAFVNKYLQHFLNDNPAMSAEDDYQISMALLKSLSLKDVDAIGKKYYRKTNRDIIIMAPEKDKDILPTEALVNQWISEVENEAITPYQDKVSNLPLLSKQPKKGKIISQKFLPEVKAKELTLSNGIKVILKQTDFKNDEINIASYSPGGTAHYSDNEYLSASFANRLVGSSGVGQLDASALEKYLVGKDVSVWTGISERQENINATSDKEGLKTAFELIYAYFTEPRIDDDIFQSTIARNISAISNQEQSPEFIFGRDIQKALFNGNIRRMPITKEGLESISKEKALAVFKDRFADASDFVFVIVGSFNEKEIKPLLETYLASLPKLNRKDTPADLGLYEPKNGIKVVTEKGQEDKVSANLAYIGDYNYNQTDNYALFALETILTYRLIERLREEEGLVYSIGARSAMSKLPKGRYRFSISINTGTKKYEDAIKSTLSEIEKIKKNGPSAEDLSKFKIEKKRQSELSVKENSYWIGKLLTPYSDKEKHTPVQKHFTNLEKVTAQQVKEVANKYLNENQLFQFILLPNELPVTTTDK